MSFIVQPAPMPTLTQVLAASGITPAPDGEMTTGVGGAQEGVITTQSGIITSKTDATP